MQIPELKIGYLTAKIPIIQGGMGVGISLSKLAAAVANNGAIGVISATEIGFNYPGYEKNRLKANIEALRYHIRQAKVTAPQGILGVNLMVATNNYELMARTAVEEGINIIFSGAGLPLNLPKYTKKSSTLISPIISSGRGAEVICKHWIRKHDYLPDAIVLEGPLAGGHLGFKIEDLNSPPSLDQLIKEVREAVKPFENQFNRQIPIIAGGGIVDGYEIARMLQKGAHGVQIGTLFAATDECDASLAWKKELIRAKKNDVIIIQSPVGLPGRAVKNQFLEEITRKRKPFSCSVNCLRTCTPATAPYCIASALINAQSGNLKEGFAFTGANVYRIDKIKPVKEVIEKLCSEIIEYDADPILV